MRSEEKRRKFNEAVVKLLYPSPPSSPPKPEEPFPFCGNISEERFETDVLPGGSRKADSSTSDDGGFETQKLTRAQRKRHRRKKLKEDLSRRRQIVGPLLPSTNEDRSTEVYVTECEPQGVRRNSSEKPVDKNNDLGEQLSGSIHNKAKQRRVAKKLAKKGQTLHETLNKIQDRSLPLHFNWLSARTGFPNSYILL